MNWKIAIANTVFMWAISNLLIKIGASNLDIRLHVFFFVFGMGISTIIFCIVRKYQIEKPTKKVVGSLISGLMCGIGIVTTSFATSLADGSKVLSIIGLSMPVSAMANIIIFKEKLTWKILLGAIFAVLSIYLLST